MISLERPRIELASRYTICCTWEDLFGRALKMTWFPDLLFLFIVGSSGDLSSYATRVLQYFCRH